MQLYTKILIGMAVGAVVGLLFGPNSLLLTHDVYAIRDASQIVFQQNPTDASSRVKIPAGVPIQMRLLETTFEQQPDLLGEEREVPVWVKVGFPFSQRLALADQTRQTHPTCLLYTSPSPRDS